MLKSNADKYGVVVFDNPSAQRLSTVGLQRLNWKDSAEECVRLLVLLPGEDETRIGHACVRTIEALKTAYEFEMEVSDIPRFQAICF